MNSLGGETKMLAGEPLTFELPRLVVRHDLAASAYSGELAREQTARHVVAAALGLTWPSFLRKAGTPRWRHDVLDYGAEVLQLLLARGVPMADIVSEGNSALERVLASLETAEQLEEARGNFGAGSAPARSGSESSTGSSGPGTETLTGSAPSTP